MNKFLHFLVVLACAILVSGKPGIEPHVIGGTASPNGSFPFAVSLRAFNREFFCGGAIIHEKFILTAAHCVDDSANNIFVGVGSVHLSEQIIVSVDKKFVNPGYKPPKSDHDIALLRLQEPLEFSSTVQMIDFPYNKSLDNKVVTAMGWGRVGPQKPVSPVLMHLNKTAISNEECNKRLNVSGVPITAGHICFGGELNYGVCFGDSGSPLLYVEDGKKYTVGVVSWGIPCATGLPDVFSRVSFYSDWIKKTIKDNE